MVADMEELETMGASVIYPKKTQCKEGNISEGKWTNLFFQPQMDEQNLLEEIRN